MSMSTPPKFAKSMMDLSISTVEDTPRLSARKPSIEIVGEMEPKEEILPPIIEENESKGEKVKIWPAYQEERIMAENERMYRDIIYSPNLKEKPPGIKMPPPRKSDKCVKEEKEAETESHEHNILLEKILDN
jgi:hypothetical protein